MREILFKAKVKNWKQLPKEEWWVEGYYGIKGKGTELEEHFIICSTFSPILSTYPFYFTDIQIDPDTLCQYTGLTDKNGKKIWENDIVKVSTNKGNTLCKVRYADNVAQFQLWQFTTLPRTATVLNLGNYEEKVIGNIFDNPELLEGERC